LNLVRAFETLMIQFNYNLFSDVAPPAAPPGTPPSQPVVSLQKVWIVSGLQEDSDTADSSSTLSANFAPQLKSKANSYPTVYQTGIVTANTYLQVLPILSTTHVDH